MQKINEEEIKVILMNKYGHSIDRKLTKNDLKSGYGNFIIYSLDGSPPKGYALYIPEHQLLCLYDGRGKMLKEFTNIEIS